MSSLESCVYFLNDKKYINNRKKPIYKMLPLDFFVKNELTNSKRLNSIPNWKSMFYICLKEDDLTINEIALETRRLQSTRKIGSENSVLLKWDGDGELISLKNYLKPLSSPKQYIYTMIEFYKHLLGTLQTLNDQQIVHNFITMDTILVNKTYFNPVITNFSFSLDLKNGQQLKPFFQSYEPSYIEWPLELHILSYLLTNKLESLSLLNIERIVHDVLSEHKLLYSFGDTVVSSFQREGVEYFSKYVNQSYETIVKDILQYSGTWDNYALSIMFLRILIYVHRCLKKENKFIIFFMKLLVQNIHFCPLKRLSVVETTNKFAQILDQMDIQDYKQLIQDLVLA